MSELSPGQLILDGRFRIDRRIATGGMGDIYAAEQVSLGRAVAIKLLREDVRALPAMEERFRREAQLLSSIDHPSVVRVVDFGQTPEAAFLVMEMIEGDTLETVLERGALDLTDALPVLRQLAEGLAAIHAGGIVHRDLKPENVVLTRGPLGLRARLLDFGIARLADGESNRSTALTQVGLVLGTPEYVSPEQAMGHPLDARSDIYSFGIVAYRVLSGHLPFDGPSAREYLSQHLTASPRELLEMAPRLAPQAQLAALVMRCLQKDRALRPVDGAELTTLVQEAIATDEASSLAAPPPPSNLKTAMFGVLSPESRTTFFEPSSSAVLGRAQNLTLMLTDIEGFTQRTSSQTLEENARMLEEHDLLLLPLVHGFGGRLLQKRGDALFAGFRSPTDAVRCGLAMQDALWKRNQLAAPEAQLRVRVALHLGEVLVSSSGAVGAPAQIVSQVEKHAEGGEVVLTEAVRLAMNRETVELDEHGKITLPSGAQLPLHRCRARAEGPPFGGDHPVPAHGALLPRVWELARPEARAAVRARLGQVRRWIDDQAWKAKRRLASVTPRQRVAVIGAAVMLLGGGVGVVGTRFTTTAQAERLLEAGEPANALVLLEGLEKENRAEPKVQVLEARILHGLKRHEQEWTLLENLEPGTWDAEAIAGVAEDYGRTANATAKALLEKVDVSDLESVAEGELSWAQWGALRLLDRTKKASGLALADLYEESLASDNCMIRKIAAARLGELDAVEAIPALEALSKSPKAKPSGVFDDGDCGHEAAAATVKRLQKKRP